MNTPTPTTPSRPTQASLWERLFRRGSGGGTRAAVAAREQVTAPSIIHAPTHRPLTAKDLLWTRDAATGRRVYRRLVVEGQPGHWAGREWMHYGEMDGVVLVAWAERDNLMALQHPYALAGGQVRVIEGGQP